jgi:hypothetical protein
MFFSFYRHLTLDRRAAARWRRFQPERLLDRPIMLIEA